MVKPNLSVERLREVLEYEPETGIFRWKTRTSNRIRVGSIAGSGHGNGYVQINIDGRNHFAHRLAWLYMHGKWPAHHIDHINGDRGDNRAANLRDVAQSTNNENMRVPGTLNTSGLLGASWSTKDRIWVAHISVKDKSIYLGSFATKEAAHDAYIEAKRRLHAGCTL